MTLNTWTSGYVEGLDYTHGFYRQLTPAILNLAALAAGTRFDMPTKATYCELGCGQGFSVNLLAAANPDMEFYANDFNPAHVAGARKLADEAGLQNTHFFDDSFAEFVEQPKLPIGKFDFIVLNGVLSWVSSERRREVVEFIRRKLKPAGMVFVSYNSLPGWAHAMPVRRLLVDHAARDHRPLALRIDAALEFAESLRKADAAYFAANPTLAARLSRMKPMSRNYLAHEYFNRDWSPFYFEDVSEELSAAKVSYIGSADLLHYIDELDLTQEHRSLLEAESDPLRREGLRDFMVNEQFRQDLFVKGSIEHTFRSAAGQWLETPFVLSKRRSDVPLGVKGRRGVTEVHQHIYAPVLDALAAGPLTVRELLGDPNVAKLSWEQLTRALMLLVGADHVQPCVSRETGEHYRTAAERFNKAVCERAKDHDSMHFLASPLTGGGLEFDRMEQLFLLAWAEGHADASSLAVFAWRILAPQGYKLLKDGLTLGSPDENVAELVNRAELFFETKLPVAQSLAIAR